MKRFVVGAGLVASVLLLAGCDPWWRLQATIPVRGAVDTACVRSALGHYYPARSISIGPGLDSAGTFLGTAFRTGTEVWVIVTPYPDDSTLVNAYASGNVPPKKDSLAALEHTLTALRDSVVGACTSSDARGTPVLHRALAR